MNHHVGYRFAALALGLALLLAGCRGDATGDFRPPAEPIPLPAPFADAAPQPPEEDESSSESAPGESESLSEPEPPESAPSEAAPPPEPEAAAPRDPYTISMYLDNTQSMEGYARNLVDGNVSTDTRCMTAVRQLIKAILATEPLRPGGEDLFARGSGYRLEPAQNSGELFWFPTAYATMEADLSNTNIYTQTGTLQHQTDEGSVSVGPLRRLFLDPGGAVSATGGASKVFDPGEVNVIVTDLMEQGFGYQQLADQIKEILLGDPDNVFALYAVRSQYYGNVFFPQYGLGGIDEVEIEGFAGERPVYILITGNRRPVEELLKNIDENYAARSLVHQKLYFTANTEDAGGALTFNEVLPLIDKKTGIDFAEVRSTVNLEAPDNTYFQSAPPKELMELQYLKQPKMMSDNTTPAQLAFVADCPPEWEAYDYTLQSTALERYDADTGQWVPAEKNELACFHPEFEITNGLADPQYSKDSEHIYYPTEVAVGYGRVPVDMQDYLKGNSYHLTMQIDWNKQAPDGDAQTQSEAGRGNGAVEAVKALSVGIDEHTAALRRLHKIDESTYSWNDTPEEVRGQIRGLDKTIDLDQFVDFIVNTNDSRQHSYSQQFHAVIHIY